MKNSMFQDTEMVVAASRYGLLLGQTACYCCHAVTPTAAVWVGAYVEIKDGGEVGQGDGALLSRVKHLDEAAASFVLGNAPWLPLASTRTSGETYYAHHCTTCGALQGDHFVFSPDGPYWPQDDVEFARLRYIEGPGALTATAVAGESAWMERVEDVCTRE